MPLPEKASPSGYVLKNSKLFEQIRFNGDGPGVIAVPTTAANRGEDFSQAPTALYYEQHVFFAEGPSAGGTVHTENGTWLNLRTIDTIDGPYGPLVFQEPNQQPAAADIAKQMSIPHGNSVLAIGSFDGVQHGAPHIGVSGSTLPTPSGLDTAQYGEVDGEQNLHPELTKDPNSPLRAAVDLLGVEAYMHWAVTTKQRVGPSGNTLNIPFEQRVADVSEYSAEYWLLSTDGSTFEYLAYRQDIELQMSIEAHGTTATYTFPHVTVNVLTKQSPS